MLNIEESVHIMRLKNKEQLVKMIEDLEVNDGFDLKGHYKTAMNEDNELTFGIRCIDIIDSICIVFGGYGAVNAIFDLSHELTDDIVDKMLEIEGLKITDIEVLEERECW